MESKSSATSSPRAALKVSITKKVNDRLKNDLKELEKVSMPKIKPSLGQKSARNYPSLKDEHISINEIRSRAYQAAFPAPKSHHYVMKGKNVANTSFDALNQDEDEGINEPNESASDSDSDPLRSHQNTPNSLYMPEPIQQIAMNRQNFLNYFYSQPKPAILPSTGTASSAKFVQRPRPQKKHKTVLRPLKKAVQYDMVSMDSAKTEVELQQQELEREVKWMVDEAKKIANLKTKKVTRVDKKELDSSPIQSLEDKKIVKGVEGLITAIKSGQLVSEQEQSNKKIQEILGTVLDKTSLSLFDPSFSEKLDEQKELLEERSMVDSAINADSIRDSLGAQSVRTITDNLELDPEVDKTSSDTDTQIDGQTVKSMVSSYQDEMDTYLASLPPLVTKEDVLNTTATSLRLIEKSGHSVEPRKPRQSIGKQKNWRNLHQFCVFEYERRDSMLLPDQLVDVTRKYHVHKKYEREEKESGRPSDSFVSQKSAGFNEQFIAYNRTDRAAKRVVDNLADLMHFDEKKSYTTIDSGFEDPELDVWRKKAEQSLELDGKQVVMQSLADYKEFTLTFLKPAPPKMSVKPSRIRERLFAEYRSMPPPLDDMNLLANKKRNKVKMFANGSDSLDEENGDGSDEESVDESALEFELILDKLLNRQYCSDTDLSKFKRENEGMFDGSAKMARSMSESVCGKGGRAQPDVYDYDFMRIDSNYNEALEEAVNQKKVIKSDYLKKSRLISGSVSSLKSKTKSMQGEKMANKEIDFKNDKSMSSTNGQNKADGNFFPKSNNFCFSYIQY
ncbi:hypothetical protein BpHYR1_037742 [Brachionus plicatilis]|uniref:Uncharacterized protein n=1 Tax=Brachionus plicatilis TaxID=10195 RepID=A0A3M7RD19_BRAPC|nr:hypothetical protein BpHYR1_037742 [Brachionus plicatilis]